MVIVKSLVRFGNFSSSPKLIYDNISIEDIICWCSFTKFVYLISFFNGPQVPPPTSSLPKVVENEPKVTKDTVPPTNNGSTKDVQPPVVQVQPHVPNSEPVVTSVSAPMPNLKLTIPYPS
ncbi:hypothetical protein Tco_0258839, partial [Tanacetum coccineum]